MKIEQNISLSKHTYFRLGGPADYFVEVKTKTDLIDAVLYALNNNLPYLVIGGGSNVLFNDLGYRGLVIKNKTSGVKLRGFAGGVENGKVDLKEAIVEAESGVTANYLIRYTLDEGLAGLEEMLGLPGTVGGAVYNNSHHLDKLWGDHIIEVEAVTRDGKLKKYSGSECQFAYDYSIFHKTQETILSASFQLKRGDKTTLWEAATAAVKRRSRTQPLGLPSSGCMFKNISLADKLRLGIPTQSAGYLIDKAGLKGTQIGGAVISDIHANFIVNNGTAKSSDVVELISNIKTHIKAKFGVNLVEEVIII